MERKEVRKIAKKILSKALSNMPYYLEDEDYKDLTREDVIQIENELWKMELQIIKRYKL